MKAYVIDIADKKMIRELDTQDNYYADVIPDVGEYIFENNGKELYASYRVIAREYHYGCPTAIMLYVERLSKDWGPRMMPWERKRND